MSGMVDVFQGRGHMEYMIETPFPVLPPSTSLVGPEEWLSSAQIIDEVCKAWGIRYQRQLFGRDRTQHIATARQVAQYMVRDLLRWSFPRIGDYFRRDHSSCIHSYNLIRKRMRESEPFAQRILRTKAAILTQHAGV